jgi:hypothetical protein
VKIVRDWNRPEELLDNDGDDDDEDDNDDDDNEYDDDDGYDDDGDNNILKLCGRHCHQHFEPHMENKLNS